MSKKLASKTGLEQLVESALKTYIEEIVDEVVEEAVDERFEDVYNKHCWNRVNQKWEDVEEEILIQRVSIFLDHCALAHKRNRGGIIARLNKLMKENKLCKLKSASPTSGLAAARYSGR